MENQIQAKTSDRIQADTSITRSYAASFIDRFMDFVKRLPYPYWLTFLVLFILQSILAHIVAWIDGWLPAFTFSPILLIFPLWLWGPMASMTYLNSVAREALSTFSPLLNIEEEKVKKHKYEFTTMPARSVLLGGLFWSIVYVSLTYSLYESFYVAYGLGTFLAVFIFLEGLVSFFIGSAIYYHSLRQLRLVNRTVKMVKQFNLFQLEPVYSFSRVTSRTGISWMILLTLTLLCYPIQLTNAAVWAVLVLQIVLALAAFVLPLRFVNYHLVAEKRRLLAELDQRIELTLEQLHRCIDENEMVDVVQLNSALTGLNTEHEVLNRIPTWPWPPGTLTSFLSAIILPIILFLVQLAIKNWLGE